MENFSEDKCYLLFLKIKSSCHIQLTSTRLTQSPPQCESSCFGVVTLEIARFLEVPIGEEVPVTLGESMN